MELSVLEIVGIGIGSLILVFALKAYLIHRFLQSRLSEDSHKKIPAERG